MFLKRYLSFVCLFFLMGIHFLFAQNTNHFLKIGTQIPYQYNGGAEISVHPRMGVEGKLGILTAPYDKAILSITQWFGVDDTLKKLIDGAFKHGTIIELGANYHFKQHYVGIFGQFVRLKAAATPVSIWNSFTGLDFAPLNPSGDALLQLTMKVNLYQLGVVYGHRFAFKNPRWELHTEVGVSKTIASKSILSSNRPRLDAKSEVQALYKEADDYLNDEIFIPYVIVPTLNVYVAYKLSK